MNDRYKNLLKYMLVLIFVGIVGVLISYHTKAENDHYLGVQPIISDDQYDKNKTYYDLKPILGRTYDFQAELMNSADTPIVVRVKIASAVTNENGIIDYANTGNKKKDQTLNFELADHIEYQEKIEIPAKSSTQYSFQLTAPRESFEGLIVGGVNFLEEPLNSQNLENKKGDTSFNSQYSYLIGIVLHGTVDPVKSDMRLNYVFADLDNYHNSLNANLSNPTASLITDMKSNVKIYDKSDTKRKKVLYEDNSQAKQMAPNSNFN
ncbi:MAG: DUF916 and DUF3324 domain-containing protein, partial [Lactobacillales bacterium]|nr:DUF916 and DUF3324 domain-containing protein [Lactobacillales bacterium]